MRLYTRTGATTVDHPEYGHFDVDPDGWVDLPEELAEQLHRFHMAGKPMWETDLERQNRLVSEELERRKDPATLLSAVEQLVKAAGQVGPAQQANSGDGQPAPAAKRGPGRPRKTAQARTEK